MLMMKVFIYDLAFYVTANFADVKTAIDLGVTLLGAGNDLQSLPTM
jgi:hypothetical protein